MTRHPNAFHRSTILLLAGSAVCACLAQFNGANIPICGGCPFPLVGDIDSDNDSDLVMVTPDTISWMANDGTGSFAPPLFLLANTHHLRIDLIGDADNDGDPDMAGATVDPVYTDSTVAILRNSNGVFTTEVIDQHISATRPPEQFTDLDGDGDQDLLSVDGEDHDVWYRNMGSYHLRERISHWCEDVVGPYAALDLDQDGDLDLVALSISTHRLMAIWNLGAATFSSPTRASPFLPIVPPSAELQPVDVNGDVAMDLVVGGRAFTSLGNGSFDQETNVAMLPQQSIANVDCESALEAIVGTNGQAKRYRFNTSDIFSVSSDPNLVATSLADLDGDGRIDLLLGTNNGVDSLHGRLNNAELPVVQLELPFDTLPPGLDLALEGGFPNDGGYYSGGGVYHDTLHTSDAEPGWVLITYTYSSFNDPALCANAATDSVFIDVAELIAEHVTFPLLVSPVPARETLQVISPRPPRSWQVTDASGRTLHPEGTITSSSGQWRVDLDVRTLAPGCYLLNMQAATGQYGHARFVVVR